MYSDLLGYLSQGLCVVWNDCTLKEVRLCYALFGLYVREIGACPLLYAVLRDSMIGWNKVIIIHQLRRRLDMSMNSSNNRFLLLQKHGIVG